MPDPDGFKVCRTLRKFPAFRDTPILIVTALNDEDSRVVSFGAGADDFLSKPFKIGEVGTRIKKLLAKKNLTLDTTRRGRSGRIMDVPKLKGLADAADR